MGMHIHDGSGQWVEVGSGLHPFVLTQPLVVENRETYSFPFGDAELVQIALPDIYIVYGDMLFRQHRLHFRATDIPDMVELHFVLSGNGMMYNNINNRLYIFQPNHQNIIYMPELDGTGEYDIQSRYRFFEVHFTKERFLNLARDSGKTLDTFAAHIEAGHYTQASEQNLPVSAAMHRCIHDIMHCSYSGGLKLLFLQAKCIELLVLQAEAFEAAEGKQKNPVLKSAYDKECIYRARDYLLEHLDTPPSLPELARIAGTNEFKLKNGFKELLGNSVFGYLNDYRLTQAKERLLSGMPIKAVSEDMGYSSVQHFGTAFRKKFGISPGRLIRQQ